MKKIVIGGLMAFAAFVVVSPGSASAESPSASAAYNSAENRKAIIDLCERRLTGARSTVNTLEKYRNASYVRPTDLSPYPSKEMVVLGGKKQMVQTAKSTKGDYKDFTNFVLANDRYKGASAVASKSFFKAGDSKGKVAYNVAPLNAKAQDLDSRIASWNTLLTAMEDGFKDGAKYKKGEAYGWVNTQKGWVDDNNLKASNTFTLSFDPAQCKTKEGRQNAAFLMKRRAVMIRAAKQGIKDTRNVAREASAEYKKMNEFRKSNRKNIEYRP